MYFFISIKTMIFLKVNLIISQCYIFNNDKSRMKLTVSDIFMNNYRIDIINVLKKRSKIYLKCINCKFMTGCATENLQYTSKEKIYTISDFECVKKPLFFN